MHWLDVSGVWELGVDGSFFLQVVAGLAAGLATGAVAYALALFRNRRGPRRQRSTAKTFDDRLSELRRIAGDLSRLSSEVKADASAQIRLAERAAAEAEKNTKLASVTKEQAQAVAEVFEAQGRLSIKVTIWIGVVSLIVSNVVTLIVTLALSN